MSETAVYASTRLTEDTISNSKQLIVNKQFKKTTKKTSKDKESLPHEDKDQDFKFNEDAVKFIQFDFTPTLEEQTKPQLAPIHKSWMEFQVDLAVPRSMIDTTRIRKPKHHIRLNPYTIWTKYGENPVYDVLVFGNQKRFEMHMKLNIDEIKDYVEGTIPVAGRSYNPNPSSAVVIGNLDFIGFIYDNFNKQGRIRKHNRKHANAWKTYNNATSSLLLSSAAQQMRLKAPNYDILQTTKMLNRYATADSTTLASSQPNQHKFQKTLRKKKYRKSYVIAPKKQQTEEVEELPNNMDDLYKLIRQKQVQDSIKRKELFRKDKADQNIYELEQQQRKLKERQN